MTTHVNKVHHVTTITQVANDLGEDEDWLRDVANEMKIEDGAIWVFGVGEDGVQAFTDFGIERLIELIQISIKKIRGCLSAGRQNNPIRARPTPNAYFLRSVALEHSTEQARRLMLR
ncbi:hypothetical protein [Bradyrhizobium rifense]|uniref:hypothetical protein n=1 Tax=Bradyrhizobium rifense TaxID=515499 RepID=UPI001FEB8CB5|nr:hypothetical protein [Bradyrhizobium rifense]